MNKTKIKDENLDSVSGGNVYIGTFNGTKSSVYDYDISGDKVRIKVAGNRMLQAMFKEAPADKWYTLGNVSAEQRAQIVESLKSSVGKDDSHVLLNPDEWTADK